MTFAEAYDSTHPGPNAAAIVRQGSRYGFFIAPTPEALTQFLAPGNGKKQAFEVVRTFDYVEAAAAKGRFRRLTRRLNAGDSTALEGRV